MAERVRGGCVAGAVRVRGGRDAVTGHFSGVNNVAQCRRSDL